LENVPKVFLPNGHSIVMKLCGRKYSKVPMFNERRVSEARELTLKRKKKLSQFKLHDLDSGVAPIPGEPKARIAYDLPKKNWNGIN